MNQRARWLLGLTVLVLVVILANEVADAKKVDYTGLTPAQIAELKALRQKLKAERAAAKQAAQAQAEQEAKKKEAAAAAASAASAAAAVKQAEQQAAHQAAAAVAATTAAATAKTTASAKASAPSDGNARKEAAEAERKRVAAETAAYVRELQRSTAERARAAKLSNERWTKRMASEKRAAEKAARRQKSALNDNNRVGATRKKAKDARVASITSRKAELTQIEAKMAKPMTPEVRQVAQEKLNFMVQATLNSPNGIITMDSATYRKYVHQSPRPYWTVVTFTALTSSHRCPTCTKFNDVAHVPAARLYNTRLEKNQASATTLVDAGAEAKAYPVFFVVVDAARNQEIFQALAIQSAPVTFMLQPQFKVRNPATFAEVYSNLKSRHRLNPTNSPTRTDMTGFVARFTGETLTFPESTPVLPLILLLLTACAGVAGIYYLWDQLLVLRNFTLPYALLSWLGYVYGVSGMMFNNLNNVPWAGRDGSGAPVYISGGNMDQYGAESVIMGFATLMCASMAVISVLLAYPRGLPQPGLTKDVATIAEEEEAAAAASSSGRHPQHVKKGKGGFSINLASPTPSSGAKSTIDGTLIAKLADLVGQSFAPSLVITLLVFAWVQIVGIYNSKNRHYRMGFVW